MKRLIYHGVGILLAGATWYCATQLGLAGLPLAIVCFGATVAWALREPIR